MRRTVLENGLLGSVQRVPPMAGCAVPSAAAEGKSKRKTSGGPSGEDSSGRYVSWVCICVSVWLVNRALN